MQNSKNSKILIIYIIFKKLRDLTPKQSLTIKLPRFCADLRFNYFLEVAAHKTASEA
jgi:hypothetical protein